MDIHIQEDEKKLILWMLERLTIKPVDLEAVPISIAALSLFNKLKTPELAIAGTQEPEVIQGSVVNE